MNTCRHQAHLASHRPQVPLERPRAISGARTQRQAYAFAHGAPRMDSGSDIARGARCHTLRNLELEAFEVVRSMIDLKAKRHVPVCFKSCGLLPTVPMRAKARDGVRRAKKRKRDRHKCRSCSDKGAASSCSDDGGRYSIRAAATALKHARATGIVHGFATNFASAIAAVSHTHWQS